MIRAFIFIMRYNIIKEPSNLARVTREFFKLNKNNQRKVLNKYFDELKSDFSIENYFDTKESRYYDGNEEVTFFNCYYFDKLILEHNINNIRLVDKFKLNKEKINYLINYVLEICEEDNLKLDSNNLVNYKDNLPTKLGKSTRFMKYLVELDYTNIRYLIHNELCPFKQREIIKSALIKAEQDEYNLDKFLKQDKTLPNILLNNFDFIIYLVKNDIENVKYLKSDFLESLVGDNKEIFIKSIIYSISNKVNGIKYVEDNGELANVLNREVEFINCIIKLDILNIKYIDWYNITSDVRNNIINNITDILINSKKRIDIMSYPFRDLFFQNYKFMEYLIKEDFRWIAVNSVNKIEENDKLIELFFERLEKKKYKFKLTDFLGDGEYLNNNLIRNKKMLHYLFVNRVVLIKHINFFNLENARMVVENICDELEKTNIDYKFKNEDYLINNKYPIVLSNSYRFMRFVIDKDFNNIAYIDTSIIDKRELKRIINYAFRMVYFIRGKNKKLNFDLNEEYFKNSSILKEDYFIECLKSL